MALLASPLVIATAGFTAIRSLGGLFGAVLLVATWFRYRRRGISRLNLIITGLVAVAIIALAVRPRLFNPLFETFNFEQGNQRQLVAALVFAVFILFALVLRTASSTDSNAVSIRLLIEALTVQSFDPAQVDRLPPGDKLVVVMPAHQEADNVGQVIASMPPTVHDLPVATLVVDDASDDRTTEVATKEGALVARLPIRRGQGMALRVGYEIALRLGATVIASLDSDGQHDPDELPKVVGPIHRGEADMVVGSRIRGDFERESRARHAGMLILSGLVSLLHGQRLTDVSSGFRAMSSDLMRRLNLEQDQYSSEILVEALRQGARIIEVPITVRARASGQSKKPTSLKYGYRFSKVIIQTWLR
jgi:hypothetical protein